MQMTLDRPGVAVATRPDTYATLLVHAQPGAAATRRVEAAARLARKLEARLIGLGAEAFDPALLGGPFSTPMAAEWVNFVQDELAQNQIAAEAAFRRDAAGADIEWRSLAEPPARALLRMAHAADLIVMERRGQGGAGEVADPADVVMGAGRPVLVVPEGTQQLDARAVVVAWKDRRECRRAVTDALPFLRAAEDVVVHAICPDDDDDALTAQASDVAAAMVRRGVPARAMVTRARDVDVADELNRVTGLVGADLIVCGAFGHSRVREWVLGGVTDTLLHRPGAFVLMSH